MNGHCFIKIKNGIKYISLYNGGMAEIFIPFKCTLRRSGVSAPLLIILTKHKFVTSFWFCRHFPMKDRREGHKMRKNLSKNFLIKWL